MKVLILLFLVVFVALCSAQQPISQVATDDQNQNDYLTLQYALTLEHLEAEFYRQGLARFSAADFASAGYSASVRPYITMIGMHEDSHVQLLTSVLETNGVAAVRACTYNFNASLSSVRNFITTAQVLEVTGTRAYDGAANTINNAVYLEVAATIATVEARHSAYLNELNNQTAFPDSFEQALSPQDVINIASQFLVSCPDGDITLPVFAFTYVPLDMNMTYYFNRSGQLENLGQINNDNDLLNYALSLELFGGAFYNNAANFTRQQFADAGFAGVYDYFQMIIAHERAHVEFLRTTLLARGAAVAQPCTYNFGNALDSVTNALNFARVLENLEVTAYDGAINTITDYQLIQGAATIATVEARHAQYLNVILTGVAVNNASLDMANNPMSILNQTASFFGPDCVRPRVPQQAYNFQALNAQAAQATPTPAPSTAAPSPSTQPPTPTPTPAQPTPTPSQPTPSPSQPTPSPSQPTPTPSCPAPTATPSGCSATPSPCGCNGNNGNNDEGNVIINFYFADMLRGL